MMRKLLLTSVISLVSCGGFDSNPSVESRSVNSPKKNEEEKNETIEPGSCDDPLNPIKIGDACYKSCDKTYKYCLRHDEMPSQLDEEKKVPVCSFEEGKILIDDKCGRGVLTIDSEKMLFKVGNNLTNQALYEYLDGSEFRDKYTKYYYGSVYDTTTVYDYPSKFPMLFEPDSLFIGHSKVAVARQNPGFKDHPKLDWIININGHILETRDMNAQVVKDYCRWVFEDLTKDDINSKLKISEGIPQDNTYNIGCRTTLYREGHPDFRFFCHSDTDKCYIGRINL